jgi:hypothetical protein
MAKQLKSAIIAAFIVWLAVTTGARYGLFCISCSRGCCCGCLAYFCNYTRCEFNWKDDIKGINASAGNFGSKFAARAPLDPRQIVYGKCRIGGTIIHMETSGTDNYLLHMVVALAGHEIEELTNLRLNDINCTTQLAQ